MLHRKYILCYFGLVIGFVLIVANSVFASLVLVDPGVPIYRTGSGENALFWSFDMSDFYNKTYSQQAERVEDMALSNKWGYNDWHVATLDEVSQLVTFEYGDHNEELANLLGMISGDVFRARFDHEIPPHIIGAGNHAHLSLSYQPGGGWKANFGWSYYDDDLVPTMGLLAVATPEPGTFSIFAIGGLFLWRRKNSLIEKTKLVVSLSQDRSVIDEQ